MKLRGYLALTVTCLALLIGDVIQRFVIVPWLWFFPSQRLPVLSRWMGMMAAAVMGPMRHIGGARLPAPLRAVPSGPGVLVLMNHQSLFDIPMVAQAVKDGYPRIVTRNRYAKRWIPLISHMTKLYQYPLVDPTANPSELRAAFDRIVAAARTTEVPFVMFPEGTRTKDGRVARFRRKGLSGVLGTRPWTVYVLVADGFWERPRFKDFLGGIGKIDGRLELAGILEWEDPEGDPLPFINKVRDLMVEQLASMRGEATVK